MPNTPCGAQSVTNTSSDDDAWSARGSTRTVAWPLAACPLIDAVNVDDGIPFCELLPVTVIGVPPAAASDSKLLSSDWK